MIHLLSVIEKAGQGSQSVNGVHTGTLSGDLGEHPELIPLGRTAPPPPFPTDVLTTWHEAFVTSLASALQVPADLPALMTISVIAGGLSRRVLWQPWAGWKEPANLYVVPVADPAERKSAVLKAVLAPVLDAEKEAREAAADGIARVKARRAELEAELKRGASEQAKANADERAKLRERQVEAQKELDQLKVPADPLFVVEDGTVPAVAAELIAQDGRLMLAGAEGTIFEVALGKFNDGAEDLDVFLKGHCGDPLKVVRITRGRLEHPNPALTCGLMIQPDVLRSLGGSGRMRGRGFTARWLYGVPLPMVGSRKVATAAVPQAVADRYRQKVLKLWKEKVPAEEAVVQFTPDGAAAVHKFAEKVEKRLDPDDGDLNLHGWGGKLTGAVVRLAGLLHATAGGLERNELVGQEAVESAVKLANDYLIPHALIAFSVMAADPEVVLAERLVRFLVKPGANGKAKKEVSKRELYQAVKGGRAAVQRAEDIDPAVKLLVEHRYLLPTANVSTGGRPSERYLVNKKIETTA